MAEMCKAITLKVKAPPPITLNVNFKGEFLSSSDGEDYKRGYEEGHAQGLLDGQANGYDKGYSQGLADGTKEEQEKYVKITENSTTEITPDENKVLSKVKVEVDVADSYYDIFWDNYQDYGNKAGSYQGSGWNDNTFKPKYDIIHNGYTGQCFLNCKITNLKQILEDCGVVLDTSGANSLEGYIQGSTITHLPTISFMGIRSGQTPGAVFYADKDLVYIEGIITKPDIKYSTTLFSGAGNLTTIGKIEGEIGSTFNVSPCPNLDDLTVDNIVNAYADMTGQTAPVLTFHADVKAKVVADDEKDDTDPTKHFWLRTLTNKNVTLA